MMFKYNLLRHHLQSFYNQYKCEEKMQSILMREDLFKSDFEEPKEEGKIIKE